MLICGLVFRSGELLASLVGRVMCVCVPSWRPACGSCREGCVSCFTSVSLIHVCWALWSCDCQYEMLDFHIGRVSISLIYLGFCVSCSEPATYLRVLYGGVCVSVFPTGDLLAGLVGRGMCSQLATCLQVLLGGCVFRVSRLSGWYLYVVLCGHVTISLMC